MLRKENAAHLGLAHGRQIGVSGKMKPLDEQLAKKARQEALSDPRERISFTCKSAVQKNTAEHLNVFVLGQSVPAALSLPLKKNLNRERKGHQLALSGHFFMQFFREKKYTVVPGLHRWLASRHG